MKIGTYVLATKYSDGDPQDHFVVGFYNGTIGDRHFVVDGNGKNFRANGFRRIARISKKRGEWIVKNLALLEQIHHRSIWHWYWATWKELLVVQTAFRGIKP